MVTFSGKDYIFGKFLVETVFMLAFVNFFWEKGCRFFGINQILAREGESVEHPPLFTESGGINFEALESYWNSLKSIFDKNSFE